MEVRRNVYSLVQLSTPKNITHPQQKEETKPVFRDDRMAQLHPEATQHTAPNQRAPEHQSFACTICDCTEFVPNPFLRNRCNNCAHGIDCHRAPT